MEFDNCNVYRKGVALCKMKKKNVYMKQHVQTIPVCVTDLTSTLTRHVPLHSPLR